MKISNEVKVGLVAVITIVAFIWLYNFLKGKDFFQNTAYYYCVYDQVGGLAESSPVEINGYKVGIVQSIDFLDETSGKLLVVFSVSKDFRLPLNTVAEIVPVSIIAGMKVQFVYGNGPGFYSYGDTIPGKLSSSIITTIESEFGPVKERITHLLDIIDSTIAGIDAVLTPGFSENLNGTLENVNNTSKSISNIFGESENDLKEAIGNITEFSGMLARNTSRIDSSLLNLETITDTLAASDIYNTISNLKVSLEKTATLIGNLNEGQGSAGKVFTDDSLYINLSSSLESLNNLLEDMKNNPGRYVHFSLFGRKEKN